MTKLRKEAKMDFIFWIFQNIMPWVGSVFTVLSIVFFIFVIIEAISEPYPGFIDFTSEVYGYSAIVAVINLLIILVVALLIEKIFRIKPQDKDGDY